MKLKAGLKLRHVGSRAMVVDATDVVNLTNVYTLNATAALLWQTAEQGPFTAESLAERLCQEYEVDSATALSDVKCQLQEWADYGLIDCD